jgi:hypothetical protein
MALSRAEKLLIAAGRLTEEGRTDFSTEDLVVSAFEQFPDDFALRGYPKYPDSNPILTQVMGKQASMIVKGWLEKTGAKKYRLTSKGLDDLKALQQDEASTSYAHMERTRAEELGNLLTSVAFEMSSRGVNEQITFHQFCRFVGLAAGDSWQAVQGKLSHARHLAEEAQKLGESGQGLRLFHRGKIFSFEPDDLRGLRALLADLEKRFKPQMQEWEQHAG